MNCPDCGGAMWDNRETKRSPKQPDYKCKNKQCDKAVWLEKKGAPAGATPANAPVSANGMKRPLAPLYHECVGLAKRIVAKELPNPTNEQVLAAAATLFIAASRDGAPLMPAKAKPAAPPPPPPPPPEPEPEPEPEPYPDPYEDPANLPF